MVRSRRIVGSALAVLTLGVATPAFADCTVPHTLVNGQVADASQVMGNINAVAACVDATTDAAVTTNGTPTSGELAVFTGAKTIGSGDLTGDVTTSGGTATELAPSGVTAGTYSNPNITVDAKGRITAAVNGAGGGGGGDGFFEIKPPNGALLFALTNNSAGATASYNDGAKVMSFVRTDGGGSGERAAFRGKAVPAGNWDATIGFWTGPFGSSGYRRAGLALVENSTGKTLALHYNTQSGSPSFDVYYMANLNTFGSYLGGIGNVASGRMPVMFRISHDGTNYIFKISHNFGDSWDTLATVPKSSYFTADRIGIWLESYSTFTGQHRMDVFYYDDPDFP